MKKNTKFERIFLTFAFCTGLLSLATMPLRAEIPFGILTDGPFSGTGAFIFDLTGTHTIRESVSIDEGPPLDVSFGIILTQDARGKIQGFGQTSITNAIGGVDQGSVVALYKAKGTIKTSGDMTVVLLEVRAKGFGNYLGSPQNFEIKSKFQAIATTSLDGNSKGNLKIPSEGNFKFDNMTSIPLPLLMDGTWNLDFNILPDGNDLQGTGAIRLSNGTALPLDIKKGEYNPGTDESRMKMKGGVELDGFNAIGSSLKKVELIDNGVGGHDVSYFKGKVMGQKVEWEMPLLAE